MIPLGRPGWLDELPESMTEAQCRELAEDVSRTVEVAYGHVMRGATVRGQ
jgi:hypothetical protein